MNVLTTVLSFHYYDEIVKSKYFVSRGDSHEPLEYLEVTKQLKEGHAFTVGREARVLIKNHDLKHPIKLQLPGSVTIKINPNEFFFGQLPAGEYSLILHKVEAQRFTIIQALPRDE